MKEIGISLLVAVVLLGAMVTAKENQVIQPPQSERKKPENNDVPFATVDSGTISGISKHESFVIKDEGEWIGLWKNHTANLFPAPVVPSIDFASEMIVAVFAGQHNSGGWAIEIDRIKNVDNKLVVLVAETGPEPGSINTMGMTQPFHIVRLVKSQAPVVFQGM